MIHGSRRSVLSNWATRTWKVFEERRKGTQDNIEQEEKKKGPILTTKALLPRFWGGG